MSTRTAEEIHDVVRDRYGEIARKGTPVAGCCGPSAAQIAERIGYSATDTTAVPDGANLGLGCGAPLAAAALRAGETVLDLGSGAGFDAFLAVQEVGPTGRVIGVDMTDDMLAKAWANAERAAPQRRKLRGYRARAARRRASTSSSRTASSTSPDKPAVYRWRAAAGGA
jgi:SAM-dependent methyltransferase